MKKIAFVVNVDWFFLSHRLPIALAVQNQGYEVTIITKDTGKRKQIEEYGLKFIPLAVGRGKDSLLKEMKIVLSLWNIYQKEKFDVIYQVGLKLILFGTIGHFFTHNKSKQINALSGAGTLFTADKPQTLSVKLLIQIFKILVSKKAFFIFQNKDDRTLFFNITPKINKENSIIIKGSGVDTKVFGFAAVPLTSPKKIVFTGRLLKEKGVIELVEAAKSVKNSLIGKAKFIIVGDTDEENPSSLTREYIEENVIKDYIEFWGYRTNIMSILKESYAFVFPSYYGEGLPKSAIEACAIGRAVITTNSVGCREVVEVNKTGILIPMKNTEKLAEAITYLIENENKAVEWGKNAREKAEKEFDLQIIIEQNLRIINNHLIK